MICQRQLFIVVSHDSGGKKMQRFALVGCGRIAQKHAEILSSGQAAKAALVAVCDTKKDRAEAFGKKYKVPFFLNFHEMMETMGDKIDVVNILTPSGDHARHCIE